MEEKADRRSSERDILLEVRGEMRSLIKLLDERNANLAKWQDRIEILVDTNCKAIQEIKEDRAARWARVGAYSTIGGSLAGLVAAFAVAILRWIMGV